MIRDNLLKGLLLFLMISSIAQLSADTNTLAPVTQKEADVALATPAIPDALAPLRQPLIKRLEKLEDCVGMTVMLNMPRAQELFPLITPLFDQIVTLKKIGGTASLAELYRAFKMVQEVADQLVRILNKDLDKLPEFNPVIDAKDVATEKEVTHAQESADQHLEILTQKISEALHDFITTLHNQVRNQLTIIDKTLQVINTNINNKNPKNKDEIKQNIMDLRAALRQVQREMTSTGAHLQMTLKVFKVNKAILLYLQELQKNKFTQWKPFDPNAQFAQVRKVDEDKDLHEIFMEILQTSMHLEKLEKDAEKIDLTWVNKTARFVGDYIVDPFERYGIEKYLAAATFSTLFNGYVAYYFDNVFFTNPDSIFRKIFGWHVSTSHSPMFLADLQAAELGRFRALDARDQHIETEKLRAGLNTLLNEEKKPLFPLNQIEQFLSDHKTGLLVIGASLVWLNYKYYGEIWEDIGPRLRKKMYLWFTKLKGGSYIKRAEKDSEFLPTITFDDIIGLEYAKSLVYPHLKYIKDPERWDADGLAPTTGILLTGPTRTGKTHFAKAICGEIHKENPDKDIRFLAIDMHDIEEKGIYFWLAVAKFKAPCVLFIDEIDLLGLQRTEDKKRLGEFLQALSGIIDKDPKKQVIVIGTTNRPENMDSSLLQAGRLGLEIRFEHPMLADRKTFILKRLDQLAIDPVAFGIDVDKLARETRGYNFEEIKGMIDGAFIAKGIRMEPLSQAILEESLDTNLRKIITVNAKEVSVQEKLLIASHHAGQVLVHLLLNPDEKIAKVTIRQVVTKVKEEATYFQYYDQPKQKGLEQGMVFTYSDHDSHNAQTHEELTKHAKILLSGKFGEKMVTGTSSTFYNWKKNNAFNIIKSMVIDGIDFEKLSKLAQDNFINDAQQLMKKHEQDVELLLKKYPKTVRAITDALVEKQTLSLEEIKEIVKKVGEVTLA